MSSNDNMQQLSDDHTIRKPLEQSKNRIIKKLEELQDSLDLSPNAEDKLQKKQTIIDKINNICDLLMEHKIEKQDHNDPAL